MESFQEVERMTPKEDGRSLFGISYPGKDVRCMVRPDPQKADEERETV